ncbi:hypothetical protein [Pendulispora albinea]|uniref:HTH cro/C1-type domain-containing protein n=1 Tax=Pendulispora albinea TaxID=2741071 RepID=A0ABZ2LWT5_9BACT
MAHIFAGQHALSIDDQIFTKFFEKPRQSCFAKNLAVPSRVPMAIAQLSPELRRVVWAALSDLKKDLRTQKRVAEALRISPFTVNQALHRKGGSRAVLDAILGYLGTSEEKLRERYADACEMPEGTQSEPTNLTIAVARLPWDHRLSADQREAVTREVVDLVAGWGVDPTVQVWTQLLHSQQVLAIHGGRRRERARDRP